MGRFGEKKSEWSSKQKKEIPVIISGKYEESKRKAIEIIDKYDSITEGDFWILMNETKTGKMMYTGLIISHNGCLKINDTLDSKFRPECISVNEQGYKMSLVYEYTCPEQGLYEVGEVSDENCKNAYPYAMAFKRCFDRVVLKLSKLAYAGIYSDSEAEEFRRPDNRDESKNHATIEPAFDPDNHISKVAAENLEELITQAGADKGKFLDWYKVDRLDQLTQAEYVDAIDKLEEKIHKHEGMDE